jgi:hypothetical protein
MPVISVLGRLRQEDSNLELETGQGVSVGLGWARAGFGMWVLTVTLSGSAGCVPGTVRSSVLSAECGRGKGKERQKRAAFHTHGPQLFSE